MKNKVIANNLGFETLSWDNLPDCFGEKTYIYNKVGTDAFMEYKAYKNRNMHVKFNKEFTKAMNVEVGRLRQDKTPKLSDLRDSGKIEQDADMVCFVHRPFYYEPNKCSEWDLQFLIGKSRHTQGNQKIDLFYNASIQAVKEKFANDR